MLFRTIGYAFFSFLLRNHFRIYYLGICHMMYAITMMTVMIAHPARAQRAAGRSSWRPTSARGRCSLPRRRRRERGPRKKQTFQARFLKIVCFVRMEISGTPSAGTPSNINYRPPKWIRIGGSGNKGHFKVTSTLVLGFFCRIPPFRIPLLGDGEKNIPFGRALAVRSCSRDCSPALDLALRKLISPVFFSGGVFFS